MSSVEGKGGVRGDTWMGDLWFAERKAKDKSTTKTNNTCTYFCPLSIPMFVQLVKYARWLVTDFPSLTILGPVSLSHELATDFSRFLENSNSKIFWSCRVRFQVRYQ